jgi:hypothetical protein
LIKGGICGEKPREVAIDLFIRQKILFILANEKNPVKPFLFT